MALPHYLILVFLWLAFFVLSVVAFFAILFTGKYPHSIFEFNVGVLRWSWRVAYYARGAGYAVRGGTDEPVVWGGSHRSARPRRRRHPLGHGSLPATALRPRPGLNRWVLRVAGYAGLMTDRYPPFSLDQGGHPGRRRVPDEPVPVVDPIDVRHRFQQAAPVAVPTQMNFWAAQSSGPGPQHITWPAEDGDWTW